MSVVNSFLVPLFLNHGNNMVLEMIVTMKSWGLQIERVAQWLNGDS